MTEQRNFVFLVKCPLLLTNGTKLLPTGAHTLYVVGAYFEIVPSNRRRDTEEKAVCFSCKVPFLLTDGNLPCINCGTYAVSDRYAVR